MYAYTADQLLIPVDKRPKKSCSSRYPVGITTAMTDQHCRSAHCRRMELKARLVRTERNFSEQGYA